MTKQKYELISNQRNTTSRNSLAISLLTLLCILLFSSIFIFWDEIYNNNKRLNIPQKSNDIPQLWHDRLEIYSKKLHSSVAVRDGDRASSSSNSVDDGDGITTSSSKFGNYIYSSEREKHAKHDKKLVCYYTTPKFVSNGRQRTRKPSGSNRRAGADEWNPLRIEDINPHLCTHLNIGIVEIQNCSLQLDDDLIRAFHDGNELKRKNDRLKLLLWVGGGDESYGFPEMIANHTNRKVFIQSLKAALEKYSLDGIDIDFEFPDGGNSQRIHFSQLLHEIRREYQREHSTYLLSIAVANAAVFVDMCYDVPLINATVDYVNLMTYDYHFYSKGTPYTGLNAPLYARSGEVGLFETLNINYSVNYWMAKGLDRAKIIVGLATYAHSFRLVNPFNTAIYAPAEDYGSVGVLGFVSYSEICWFMATNFNVKVGYDTETCSPFLHTGLEWISYDDERSIECKTNYIKNNDFGGVMVFSLNTDDFQFTCSAKQQYGAGGGGGGGNGEKKKNFPLLRKIHSILFQNSTN